MKIHTSQLLIKILVTLVLLFLVGCEADNPASIYDPNLEGNPTPVIASIDPADSTLAGIGEITISGQHFSSNPEDNLVYFNKLQVPVITATPTELKIKTPVDPADSIKVKIAVKNAYNFSNVVHYKLLNLYWEWGGIDELDDPFGIAMDAAENLYVSIATKKMIAKVSADGEREDILDFAAGKAASMKMGPEEQLYMANHVNFIFRQPLAGGAFEFFTMPGRVSDLDFAANGNIYAGGAGNAIYLRTPDGTNSTVAEYPGVTIKAVRVFEEYVYVAGPYNGTDPAHPKEGVWRNAMQADGSLGANELIFDWGAKISTDKHIRAMTFSADGDLYLASNAPEGILIVQPDGSHEPLYPGVLKPDIYALTWGNGPYLYYARSYTDEEGTARKRIIKLNMQENGAPYFGRQ